DRRVRLRLPVMERADAGLHLERMMLCELAHVARGVRDEPDLQPGAAELVQHRQHVLVELEVLVALPAARQLDGDVVRARVVAAHAPHDPLREGDPDLLVVVVLGMALQVDERGVARLRVAHAVEDEPESLRAADVALGHQLGTRPREREVDVEENRLQRSHDTVSRCDSIHWLPPDHATVCAIVQPRARSRSSPSSLVSRSSRYSASRLVCPSSKERTIGATENSRSPASGFGSMASHGSRWAASTFCPWRSWCSRTGSPCVGASSRMSAAATSAYGARGTSPSSQSSASSASVRKPSALFQSRGRSSMRTPSGSSAASERKVPGSQRSRRRAWRSSSSRRSRTAPSPSHRLSAAASCSASRCGQKTFRAAGAPSAQTAATTWLAAPGG